MLRYLHAWSVLFNSCMDPSIAIKPVFERFQSVIITSGVNCLPLYQLFSHFPSRKAFKLSSGENESLNPKNGTAICGWESREHNWLCQFLGRKLGKELLLTATTKYYLFEWLCVLRFFQQELENEVTHGAVFAINTAIVQQSFPFSLLPVRVHEYNISIYLLSSLWLLSRLKVSCLTTMGIVSSYSFLLWWA